MSESDHPNLVRGFIDREEHEVTADQSAAYFVKLEIIFRSKNVSRGHVFQTIDDVPYIIKPAACIERGLAFNRDVPGMGANRLVGNLGHLH